MKEVKLLLPSVTIPQRQEGNKLYRSVVLDLIGKLAMLHESKVGETTRWPCAGGYQVWQRKRCG